MRLIVRIFFYAIVNLAAFVGTAYILPGFQVSGNLYDVLIAAGILTVLNIFIRPLLKIFFGPFILLTLGLFIIAVNALILYAVDFLSAGINIDGIETLLLATIIISLINFIISFTAKGAYKI